MESVSYEVVYVDKFEGLPAADLLRERIRRRFGLSRPQLTRLSSGTPVVIKRGVGLEEAKRYQEAVNELDGTCWVQSMDSGGGYRERRRRKRRGLLDRRRNFRASSILPDRRDNYGRRSMDLKI